MSYICERSTEQTAKVEHYCTLCEHRIFPGDRYVRTVKINKKNGCKYVEVYKRHDFPFCPFEPEDLPEEAFEDVAFEFKKAA